jgi:hypothetical protein
MQAQRQLTPSASPTKHYERDALGRPTKALHSNHVTLGDLSRLVKAAGLSNANKGDGSEYRTKSEIGLTNGLSNSNVVYIFFASNFEEDEVNNWNDWDYTMERCSRLALLCFRRTVALLALVDRFPETASPCSIRRCDRHEFYEALCRVAISSVRHRATHAPSHGPMPSDATLAHSALSRTRVTNEAHSREEAKAHPACTAVNTCGGTSISQSHRCARV